MVGIKDWAPWYQDLQAQLVMQARLAELPVTAELTDGYDWRTDPEVIAYLAAKYREGVAEMYAELDSLIAEANARTRSGKRHGGPVAMRRSVRHAISCSVLSGQQSSR